tara:strand:+ start:1188 stop:1382 length:195 start_codon:yes stop_codon:yes gene_type:complete
MNFISTLSQRERDTLRRVVKIVHMKHHPKDFINDYEADKLIETLAPEVIGKMIKVGIDNGILNK